LVSGDACESSGGTPTWVVQSFREDPFSEANPALTSENPKLSARKTWSTASENRQSLWRPDPAARTGEGPRRTARPAHCGFRAYLGRTSKPAGHQPGEGRA